MTDAPGKSEKNATGRKARYFDVVSGGEGPRIKLRGEWTVFNVRAIEKEKAEYLPAAEDSAPVDLSGIERIDTAGAFLIKKYFPGARPEISQSQQKLFEFLPAELKDFPAQDRPGIGTLFTGIGRSVVEGLQFVFQVFAFTGEVAVKLAGCIFRPWRFRLPSIVRHIDETGIRALPIIGLLGFLMSMVISYQAAMQLQKFGAAIFTVDLTVISLLREMGVLITAIMVAGRSGSAFAAEIGVMKLREEVDALRTMGLDPVETLVLPRLVALLITLPLLTFFANMIGLAGGAVMVQGFLDIPFNQYIDRVEFAATPEMFFVGMIKAPVFAFLIAIICTYQGMHVTGSAESVGRLTTVAVVQSIFLVILVDALFSVIFANLGI